jgi:hypothetical protein
VSSHWRRQNQEQPGGMESAVRACVCNELQCAGQPRKSGGRFDITCIHKSRTVGECLESSFCCWCQLAAEIQVTALLSGQCFTVQELVSVDLERNIKCYLLKKVLCTLSEHAASVCLSCVYFWCSTIDS